MAKLGLRTRFDLVLHLPLRYDDETRICLIKDLPHDAPGQVEADVLHCEVQFRPRRQLVCQVADASGVLYLRFFNFYPSQLKQLAQGTRVRVYGEVRAGFFGDEMVHPKYHVVAKDAPLRSRLTPVYPTTAGVSQATLGRLIAEALAQEDLSDTLPREILQRLQLHGFAQSVRYLHEPPPQAALAALGERSHAAWQRLKFDELLAQQLSMRRFHRLRAQRRGIKLSVTKSAAKLTRQLLAALPFKLTGAQQRVHTEITRDMGRDFPMRRLLQGDVGSGKTVVAALACALAIERGHQAALMAPTEILAEQHFRKIDALLAPLGVRTAWLIGRQSKKQKEANYAQVASGAAQLVIGTHALIQEEVAFKSLALVVIDEQHRFGVAQRLALQQKAAASGAEPHQLMMSATPIPRSLSMSYFADLDVSVIDELPPGRSPVLTKLVSDKRRGEVFERVRTACAGGAQAYWVCPLIEESEALQLQTALDTYAEMQGAFADLRVGLVHGRLASREKAAVMDAFGAGRVQLLVATTVIEVGVDVPNASLMVIEHAERMGLAQLHQLRGRVGRGAARSTCILLYQHPLSQNARQRLKIIFEHNDGFEIARQDLLMRGPGEFLGSRQSGAPLLRFADLERDVELLEQARTIADEMLAQHPRAAEQHVARWLSVREDYLKA